MAPPIDPSVTRVTTTPPPAAPPPVGVEADRLIADARGGGCIDQRKLADGLLAAADQPDQGVALRAAVDARLTPVERGQLQSAIDSQLRAAAAPPPAADDGPSQASVALDLTQVALDIVGIVEPTPFADGSNTIISIGRGDWWGAGASLLGVVPYLGDAAKLGKLGKWADTVSNAAELAAKDVGFRKLVEPTLEKIRDAINAAPLDSLPSSVRNTLESMRTKIDEALAPPPTTRIGDYDATVRGVPVRLEGVEIRPVDYLKRDRASYESLRREFDGGARAGFVKSISSDPTNLAALRNAGLNDAQIARLAEGKIPQGWQVHHKLPLDDGGTNSFDNLVLIKNDPSHIAITNAQRSLVGDLAVGETRRVDFPVPPGVVYPPAP
ncbi:HNH endonuclease [Glacieibacterium frigidum]|uniref:HNH endonuclease n=1 Tax=Glacieibacterium frigidum TaxID=2593303 RepID=A0A552UJ30_9SPHN|nr:HNH endonuclease [Glacieibacterium frigidum]TRW18246.1 HNH endonuclease [Glacieibacterium frigidum]